jgi:hypothetical protein
MKSLLLCSRVDDCCVYFDVLDLIVTLMHIYKHGIYNAYNKHGTPVDVFESASERRGADGIDARA